MLLNHSSYNQSEGFDLLKEHGTLLDEVLVYDLIRIYIFHYGGKVYQVLRNNRDKKFIGLTRFDRMEDWDPYLETINWENFL